ncbi:hypothetical protein EUGRSUZ_H01467 [Eucalyptus grandis]|uniref:Uncharacterized protein n=2 Tax=Eucalyptus grandis TaxID=71139 RepID=A0ACC3JPA9_EUCGR|nr:hypothetical protein EUGRSUZ_H01467 [Eucalyptus grandis]
MLGCSPIRKNHVDTENTKGCKMNIDGKPDKKIVPCFMNLFLNWNNPTRELAVLFFLLIIKKDESFP